MFKKIIKSIVLTSMVLFLFQMHPPLFQKRVLYKGAKEVGYAKDCFQNTFLKLYQTKKEFVDAEHMKAWLIRVARNECNDCYRTFWRRNVDLGFEPDENAKALFDYDEETNQLLLALHRLSGQYREVLYLYYYEEYDTAEIAKILRLNVNTVKSRLRRGRNKLAKLMESC